MSTNLMGIGQTVAALRGDFPDVSVSKIRFLESEGLVEPLRTPSGYRKFTPAHVERIRYVLTMQRDHYLPLKVIAEHLDAIDRGLNPPEPVSAAPRPQAPESGVEDLESLDTGVRLRPQELCRESGLSAADLSHAIDQGLLADSDTYGLDELEVARSLAALADSGVPVRNARPVVLAVQRELDLYQTALGSRLRSETPEEFEARARGLAAALIRAHVAHMRARLRLTGP